ncbi:STAS domain-containing protein [Actinoplanes awajinensis]|nr:STAS domain-containing protein [Actinoplanes awajinensis]
MRLSVKKRAVSARRRRIVRMTGPLAAGTSADLERVLIPESPGGEAEVELDLTGVTFISAAVVAVVFHAHFVLRRRGTALRVTGCTGQPRRQMLACGAFELLESSDRGDRPGAESRPAASRSAA